MVYRFIRWSCRYCVTIKCKSKTCHLNCGACHGISFLSPACLVVQMWTHSALVIDGFSWKHWKIVVRICWQVLEAWFVSSFLRCALFFSSRTNAHSFYQLLIFYFLLLLWWLSFNFLWPRLLKSPVGGDNFYFKCNNHIKGNALYSAGNGLVYILIACWSKTPLFMLIW